mmetsp:Transcript_21772/g.48621  ORF Transcript_21772/g.48621 Transcript_21772/m.48621 type:complete len:363 (+) Transcript_21772:259-1347(+)
MRCSIVPTVTKRQMWIFRSWPGLRTRPMACISKATASSPLAASMGCTMMTWLAAVRFVPLADSSRERRSILGLSASYWNFTSAARRAQTLPLSVRCSTPNSSRAELILRFRSSHCTKQMILQPGSSARTCWTCPTRARILEPYLAKSGACGSAARPASACACEAESVRWKDLSRSILPAASASSSRSRAAQGSRSAFQAAVTPRSFSALPCSESHSHEASQNSCTASGVALAPGLLGMPRFERSRAQRAGTGARLPSPPPAAARASRTALATSCLPAPSTAVDAAEASSMSQEGGEATRGTGAFAWKSTRRAMSFSSSGAAAAAPAGSRSCFRSSALVPVVAAPRSFSRAATLARGSLAMWP